MPWHVTTGIGASLWGDPKKSTNPACLFDRRDANEINVIVLITMMINNYFFKCVFVITSIFK